MHIVYNIASVIKVVENSVSKKGKDQAFVSSTKANLLLMMNSKAIKSIARPKEPLFDIQEKNNIILSTLTK